MKVLKFGAFYTIEDISLSSVYNYTFSNLFSFRSFHKELERKFSQTGAYKNLKKMLTAKNEQIKELRQKLKKHEDLSDNE